MGHRILYGLKLLVKIVHVGRGSLSSCSGPTSSVVYVRKEIMGARCVSSKCMLVFYHNYSWWVEQTCVSYSWWVLEGMLLLYHNCACSLKQVGVVILCMLSFVFNVQF